MPSITGFRDTAAPSPFRFLYGQRNGVVIFPLDIVFTHFNPNMVDSTGAFIGSDVSGIGFGIGRIANYTWPPLGAVTPLVEVTPDPGFPLASVLGLPSLPLPVATSGTRVVVDINGSVVGGTVLAQSAHAAYIDPSHQVSAYILQFDIPLSEDHHGAAVVDANDNSVVYGMLIATQPTANAPNALVCPV